jgi:hypothetical protein
MAQKILVSLVHEGYMAGIQGEDPNPELDFSEEYSVGWLAGAKDKEAGIIPPKYLGPVDELPCKRGDTVTIPKGTPVSTIYHGERKAGRTYKVKTHDVYQGMPAYIDYHRGSNQNADHVVRPTAPEVIWPGSGGYWSRANVNDLFE